MVIKGRIGSDPPPVSRRLFLRHASVVAGSALSAGCLTTGPTPKQRVEEHRKELSRFSNLRTTLQAGYRTSATYISADGGAFGVPFVNPNVTELSETKPQAVFYGLTESGQYEPYGCKWYVPAKTVDSPPTLFGKRFKGPFESDSSLVPRHYALHVWLFQENPDGLFARYNQSIEPPAVIEQITPVWDALDDFLLSGKAKKAGYTNTKRCIVTPDGGYGVPFVNPDVNGMEPTKPPILFYRLRSNWTYLLMGAEWYVSVESTSTPPSLFGHRFHRPMDGHSAKTDQPRHYGLHAWLFKANPDGMFAPFNPMVEC